MIKSMTGFGRAEKEFDWARIGFEVHAINKRSFESIFNLPRVWVEHEKVFRDTIAQVLHRGRVTISMECFSKQASGEFCVNHDLARAYQMVLLKLKEDLNLQDALTLRDFVMNKDIVFYQKTYAISQSELDNALEVLAEALRNFVAMREAEGERIFEELRLRVKNIKKALEEIEKFAPQATLRYEERLRMRLGELFPTKEELDIRILREVALMAEKLDITEETVRIRSHIEQFSQTIHNGASVGRILDFIVQELLRETNTLGAKADDFEISKKVIDIKNELDKIREQVQNVE